ncbi:hypothetical protein RHGRI_017912 [Rhododendron griersonianum]|uniref:arogenate dehydratase n=1 Tax=Rhododendron griersonianum TaxID=479676 RepID=A0AAV6JZH5_9ERIC|nr:hypothetical protein RHGRI_017912 [Rhododendron griersonianum]
MALEGVVKVKVGCAVPHLGYGDLGFKHSGFAFYWVRDKEKGRKWDCCGVFSGLSPIRSVDGESSSNSNSAAKLQRLVDQTEGNGSRKLQKDSSSSLPRPLTLSSSPNDGTKVRISFRGLPGAYSEDAALKAYPECETVPCDEFEDAFKVGDLTLTAFIPASFVLEFHFQAVELWLADKAVLPIENTLGGSIHRNYDLLLRHRLHIVGEVQLAVNLCLLALPGVRTEHLKHVLSHAQALAQSDIFLSKLGVVRENVDDTAGAAQLVASTGFRDAGVVASARAAEIYGLNILAEGIQTSIVFTLQEGPGVLFKALAVFALRGINLTKIESRPQRKRPLRVVDDSNTGTAKYFDYLFYIDFEASMAEPRAQSALGQLQEFATFLRVLGCYPMDTAL